MIIKYGKHEIEQGLFLAPMEDVSDYPFRMICKKLGADVMYSEFISSEALIRDAAKSIQKLLFHTPLVYLFVFGSYYYHDKIWWPFVGKRIMETIKLNTEWGRFFAEYH